MAMWTNTVWKIWSLILASFVLLCVFGRIDLLALVVPLSAVVGFGSWFSKRGSASHER
jgi:hypothetical protein